MKATGIVRHIDDLGRVVIPRGLRRTYNINEGDTLEIYTDNDAIIFKKYEDTPLTPKDWAQNVIAHYGHLIDGISVDGARITVTTPSGQFKACCLPNDDFDFLVGVAVGLAKAYLVELPDCLKRSR